MTRVPIVPTLIVALAIATLVALGVWQLQRAEWKQRLVADYEASVDAQATINLTSPPSPDDPPLTPLFHKAVATCTRVVGWSQVVGEDSSGEPGYAHLARCLTGIDDRTLVIDAGWSKNPAMVPRWTGGWVSGLTAPDRATGLKLVSATGLGGLSTSRAPSPRDMPNNHLFYAAQWFFFAAAALVIYVLALRRRAADRAA